VELKSQVGGDQEPEQGGLAWTIRSTKIGSSLSPLGSTKILDFGFLSLTSVGKLMVSEDRTRQLALYRISKVGEKQKST
jgi:hypothetical protein